MLITTRHDNQPDAAAVVLRQARPEDGDALRRLALLDDSAPLAGEVIVAEQHGALRAALSIHSDRAIADPFQHTGDLVELLRRRAELLREHTGGHEHHGSPGLLRRLARAA